MKTETRTYEHTLPDGQTLIFRVGRSWWPEGHDRLSVYYPSGIDFSSWRADEAYPMAEIERDYGCRFDCCDGYGEGDDGIVWESWRMVAE